MMKSLHFPFMVLAALLSVAFAAPDVFAQRAVPEAREQVMLSFAPLVKKASPAVVNIFTRKAVQQRGPSSPLFNDPFFRRFFGESFDRIEPRENVENSLGSGVIVRPDGLIVTNFHVIEGADTIRVVLSDRREFDAEILREDEQTDLAILKVDTDDGQLPYVELGDSDELEVGDLVLAIGNPFGVGQTVTSGIVSGLARTNVGISDFNFFIQTDAAINPGNSGGALLRMDGTLAGVNTAIFSRSGGSQGIGFAVPSNMVRTVIAGAASGDALRRAWLGAKADTVSAEIANAIGLDRPDGVILSDIHPEGPALRAGLKSGDIIVAVEDQPVFDEEGLRFRIATGVVGGTTKLRVRRPDRIFDVDLFLEHPPEIPARDEHQLRGAHPLAGATVANLSPAVAAEMGRDHFDAGVIIRDIASRSPAHRLEFRPGDIVAEVNGQPIEFVSDLREATAAPQPRWNLKVRRAGRIFSLSISG
jgi:Do/DeqQ family serine protease